MADQTITPVVIANEDTFTAIAAGNYATLTAANDGVLTPPRDGRYLLHCKCTAAAGGTLTIKSGDGVLGSQGDLVSVAFAENDEKIIVLQSSRFKALSGTDKGKIRIDASEAFSVACIQLP